MNDVASSLRAFDIRLQACHHPKEMDRVWDQAALQTRGSSARDTVTSGRKDSGCGSGERRR